MYEANVSKKVLVVGASAVGAFTWKASVDDMWSERVKKGACRKGQWEPSLEKRLSTIYEVNVSEKVFFEICSKWANIKIY